VNKKNDGAYQSPENSRDIEQELKYGRKLHDYAVGDTIVKLISGLVPCFKTNTVSALRPGIHGVKS